MKNGFKLTLFIFLFLLLWLPLFQEKTTFFRELELGGAFVKPPAPKFSIDSLRTLKFQKQFEDFENYNFGFRGLMVKIRNSVDNILFNDLSVVDNVGGKDGFIFSIGSIENTLGLQYNGKQKNEAEIRKIKFFKEGIEKSGGHLLVLIAPSKEKIYPDFLPAKYVGKYRKENNYTDFVEGYKKAGIPFIDFCAYFVKIRTTCPYPLFTKSGFHWSVFGASLAQDSLVSYVEESLATALPKYKRVGVEFSDTARDSDADYEASLNLFYRIGQSQYVYPKLEMIASTKKNYRPNVIIIGDSYFWQIKNQKMLKDVFSENSKFWFYFATNSYPLNDFPGTPLLKEVDVMDQLRCADYVILIGNLSTLYKFPYGITDYYLDHVAKPGMLESICESIRGNPNWLEFLIKNQKMADTIADKLIRQEAKRIFCERKAFNLRASNNKYVGADGNNNEIITANSDNDWEWETFEMLNLKGGEIAIYSHKGKFLASELTGKLEITATRSTIGSWETFTIVKLNNDTVAFKAVNGKYLSLDEKSLKVSATADVIGRNEKFKWKSKS